MRAGQRVFWHGLSPNPKLVGTIKRTGTLRHEVVWDGSDRISLENVGALMSLARFGKCCPYCKSLKERG